MNKKILLGLLLVPCFSYAMETVGRYETEHFISFSRGSTMVEYNKESRSCIEITVRDGGTDVTINSGADDLFMELQTAYLSQYPNR